METQTVKNQNEIWIDIAKAVSIFGVVLLHVQGYVYNSEFIYQSVRFVVALFILIGGYNAITSYERRGKFLLMNKIKRILIPYVVATIIYCVWNNRSFNVLTILDSLIHFNACSPMYYVAAYLQLLIISPVLIWVIGWCENGVKTKFLRYLVSWGIVLVVCYLSSHYTNILGIIIGGGNLFSGNWLIFWFAGMCLWKWGVPSLCKKHKYTVAIASTLVLITWHYLFVGKELIIRLTPMLDSETIDLTWGHFFEVIVLVFWFVSVTASLEGLEKKQINTLLTDIGFFGKQSLYIFLYHILCRNFYTEYLGIGSVLSRFVCLIFLIAGPVAIGFLLRFLRSMFEKMIYALTA